MAKPTTKQELIDHCLRKLGAPVLEVNVSDEQLDDCIDDAIQYFQERHFDGVERMYLKYKISQGDIDRAMGVEIAGQTAVNGTTGVGIVHLDESDVIRNKLVKKIVDAYKNIENNS